MARRSDAGDVFGRAFTRILAAVVFAGLGLALFQDEAVALLGGSGYAGAAIIVAPVLLGCVCQAAASLMDAAFYVRRRTGLKLYITMAATVVMLVLYVWLIPSWGGIGAALATLGGFAFLVFLTWIVTQRIFRVRYEWVRLAAMLGWAVALWTGSRLLPAAGWAVAARVGLWLAWPVLLWLCGLVSETERQQLRSVLAAVLPWRRDRTSPGTTLREPHVVSTVS